MKAANIRGLAIGNRGQYDYSISVRGVSVLDCILFFSVWKI